MAKFLGLWWLGHKPDVDLKRAAELLRRREWETLVHRSMPLGEIWYAEGRLSRPGPTATEKTPFFWVLPGNGSKADSHSLVESFDERGLDALGEQKGSYAYVICGNDEAFLATDYLGLQFIYYHVGDGFLAFSSEMKTLLLLFEGLRKEIDPDALCEFIGLRLMAGEKTLMKGIKLLFPSSVLSYSRRGTITTTYHTHPTEYREMGLSQSVEEFSSALSRSVQMMTKADPALLLSGGLDSRLILCMVPRDHLTRLVCINFGNRLISDVRIAKAITKRLGVQYHHHEIGVEDVLDSLIEYQWLTDGSPNLFASHLTKIVKAESHSGLMDGFLGGIVKGKVPERLRNEGITTFSPDALERLYCFPDDLLRSILSEECYGEMKNRFKRSLAREVKRYEGLCDERLKFEYFFMHNRLRRMLVGSRLIEDFCESLRPMADIDVAELLFQIPPEHRSGGLLMKEVIAKAMPEIAEIPTNSFKESESLGILDGMISLLRRAAGRLNLDIPDDTSVQTHYWFARNQRFRDVLIDLLMGPRTIDRGLYSKDGIARLIKEHDSGLRDNTYVFLRLAWLELFLRLYSDGDGFRLHAEGNFSF